MTTEELIKENLPYLGGEENVARKASRGSAVFITVKDQSLVSLDGLRSHPEICSCSLNNGRVEIHTHQSNEEEKKSMAKIDFSQLAADIVANVGGKENITSVTHCVTRLRLVLADNSKADLEKIKALPNVLNVVVSAGQTQVVLGPIVGDVYAETVKITGDKSAPAVKETVEKKTVGSVLRGALDVLVSCFTPSLTVIAGAGMLKALVALFANYGILDSASTTYTVLNAIGDGVFYFLPFFVGMNAAKKMGVNPSLGLVLAAVLLHPDFTALIDSETALTFFGLPLQALDYSAQCIPVIFGVWMIKYVDGFFSKHCPKVFSIFLPSLLDLLIVAPIMLLVVGPISVGLNNLVLNACTAMMSWGWIAVGINALIFPLLVLTGTHNATIPLIVMMIMGGTGDPIFLISGLAVNIAEGGAACAVACKTKNKELRSIGLSATVSALLGITEPALYGVNLRLKKPFIGMMLGAFVGGCYCGMVKLVAYVFATPSLMTFPLFTPDGGSVLLPLSAVAVSFAAAFIFTWLIGFEDLPADK